MNEPRKDFTMNETMTNDEFRIACLGPEPEALSESTGFDGATAAAGGDGYTFVGISDEGKMWRSHGSWGRDGWDLGDWPLVIIQTAQEGTGDDASFLVRIRVEGDLSVYRYRTEADAIAKVNHLAWWHWLNEPARYSAENMTREVMAADVDRFCGPFTWSRLDEHEAATMGHSDAEEVDS